MTYRNSPHQRSLQKNRTGILFVVILLVMFGCKSNTPTQSNTDDPYLVFEQRPTKYAVGQVALMVIMVQKDTDYAISGNTTETVLLQSDSARSIRGWQISTVSTGLRFNLPDSVQGNLYVFTHGDTVRLKHDVGDTYSYCLELPANQHLLNLKGDAVVLYDSTGKIRGVFGY